ncbi:MAG TPA: hypothetical protein VJO53_13915 [Candidatus Acidoferrales bacterium]|nr:hypothetical protein [Candidatus Acidoferrales bacterium]
MKIGDLEDVIWGRIGDEWLVGQRAVAVFAASAAASVSASAAMIVFYSQLRENAIFVFSALISALSGVFLISGMERYWARLDSGSKAARRVWFIPLTFGVWFGAALYFSFVYLPQLRRARRSQ